MYEIVIELIWRWAKSKFLFRISEHSFNKIADTCIIFQQNSKPLLKVISAC